MRMRNPVKFPDLRDKPQQKAVNVGDLVQWTCGGVDQFVTPRRVRGIQTHDGQEWVFVEGTKTGVPMSELTVVTSPSPATAAPTTMALAAPVVSPLMGNEREWLRGALSRDASYRLIVSGDIGPKELCNLIKLLQAQKAILGDNADKDGEGGT
jgi:hypothetical protein